MYPAMSADSGQSPPAKYSRYRSVRQAAASKSPPPTRAPKEQEAQNDTIQRSMSRYHRRPRVSSPSARDTVPIPALPQHLPTLQALHGQSEEPSRDGAVAQRPMRYKEARGENIPPKVDQSGDRGSESMTRGRAERRASISQRQNIAQALPLKGLGAQDQKPKGQLPEEDEVAKKLAEQKQKDLQRLEMELAAASARPSSSPERSNSASKKQSVERFRVFTRKRAESKAAPSKSSTSLTEPENQEAPKSKTEDMPRNILQGGGGVVPGVDAPKSAVNAGERRVLIRCKQCSINLPITPDTTPVDLIFSAANVLSVAVTPSASILLESYTKLGLERRIRRYEHIRDIMNSWDRDTQNALIIKASDSPNHDSDLDASSVPRVQPNDVKVYMYHSQKPGKWNKRYITLDSTGQIFISKKKDAKVTDKDIITLCHLTDFDIYTPTTDAIRKDLKPPKKYCYAVKSQQKTSMFLKTDKFVHFFSTDDYNMANTWYDACQQWRSWYLVNIKGEGKKKAPLKGRTAKVPGLQTAAGIATLPSHKVKVSVDENPYTIGSFKPLMDLDRFEGDGADSADSTDENKPRQIPFHLRNSMVIPPDTPTRRDRYPPPVSYRLPPSASNEPPLDGSTFAPTSLLGRTYSQRQRALKEREHAQQEGPFVTGPSLLNTPESTQRPKTGIDQAKNAEYLSPLLSAPLPLTRGASHRRTLSNATRARPKTSAGPQRATTNNANSAYNAPSAPHPPKPLLDLTPKFVEAPQWNREGKGHGVAAPVGVPLVEVATTGPYGQGQHVIEGGPGILFRREG